MKPFEKAVLTALSRVPNGHRQRVDGLMCEDELLNGSWWFFHFKLWLMVRKGLVIQTYSIYSPSRWLNNMPFYSISAKGKKMLSENGDD